MWEERAVPVVAAVGDNTIDHYVGDEEERYVGGNALNVAAQLALHGVESGYFGAIGDDADGRAIVDGLTRAGVRSNGVVIAPGRTAVTTIRVDRGERSFEHEDFGVTAEYFPRNGDLAFLGEMRWVHIGMIPRADELRSTLSAMRATTGRRHPFVSQDCAVADGYTALDVAFGSVGEDGDAEGWAREAISGGALFAIATRGAGGVVATDGSRWFAQDAVPTDVVDTTGAGDAFISGFIAGRLAGAGITASLTRGAETAAAACSHRGGSLLARIR